MVERGSGDAVCEEGLQEFQHTVPHTVLYSLYCTVQYVHCVYEAYTVALLRVLGLTYTGRCSYVHYIASII